MSSVRILIASAVVVGGSALVVSPSRGEEAGPSPYAGGVVVAKSRYGNGTISAQVRPSGLGWEVHLPGGRWAYCRRNCAETLRVETIDFFETNAAGAGQLTNECGVFGCLDLKYPR
jgi:hypothetical protein